MTKNSAKFQKKEEKRNNVEIKNIMREYKTSSYKTAGMWDIPLLIDKIVVMTTILLHPKN